LAAHEGLEPRADGLLTVFLIIVLVLRYAEL
jgi:hypothetical protein